MYEWRRECVRGEGVCEGRRQCVGERECVRGGGSI